MNAFLRLLGWVAPAPKFTPPHLREWKSPTFYVVLAMHMEQAGDTGRRIN